MKRVKNSSNSSNTNWRTQRTNAQQDNTAPQPSRDTAIKRQGGVPQALLY